MTTALAPSRSTRRLSEVAKHLVIPPGIETSDWPAVNRTCRTKLGLIFDGWQDGAGRVILGRDAAGGLAATVGGVGASLPRQVGKTYLFAGLLFGLAIERPGLLALWTAHHMRTHGETFLQMQSFAERPQAKSYIKRVFLGSGDEEIRFTNGSRIMFGARERGFGRGLSNVDVIIFDEAQILSERALQNMLAAMNRSDLGLHVYVGTPPKPTDNCEVFTRMRTEALSGETKDLVWFECGADDDADLDDREQWAKANPSYPQWTPEASIQRLRRKLDPGGFRREGLGIWSADSWSVFDLEKWVSLERHDAKQPQRVVLVVDVSPYRASATISAAGDSGDGGTLVLVHTLRNLGQVAPKVAELVESVDVAEVCLAPGEARGVADGLTRAGVAYRNLTGTDVAASCTAFQTAVEDGTVFHVGQQELDVAVGNARTRRIGASQTWEEDDRVDLSPIRSAAAAFYRWGLQEAPMPAIY